MEGLERFGWDGGWAQRFLQVAGSGDGAARVTAQQRDRWVMESARGTLLARLVGSGWAGRTPVTGDWVVCAPGPEPSDLWGISQTLPRRTAIVRGAAGVSGEKQALAANVDRLWIVHALDTPPNLRSLERYLTVAWESGALPEILLTKADLSPDVGEAVAQVQAVALGVEVRAVSVHAPDSIQVLQGSLAPGRTVALLGPSGVGKSTLVNVLAGTAVTPTGDVRSGDRKGRHTTTRRELFLLEGGALLLDTPGMRELKIADATQGLEDAFPDIEELAGSCRFRDCSHEAEPGCAVLAAVDAGRLAADRLESYRKLRAEAAYQRRKADPREQAQHVAEHKSVMRSLKHHPKYRERG